MKAASAWRSCRWANPELIQNRMEYLGVAVATRTTAPPMLDETAQAEFRAKSEALVPRYRTEMLQHP